MNCKRILSFVMAFVLCLSLLPVAAFSAGDEPTAEEIILEEDSETAAETEKASEITESEESSVPEESAEPAPEIIKEESEESSEEATEEVAEIDGVSGSCGSSLTWTLNSSGTLTIKGTGTMEDYYYHNSPWSDKAIKKIIISQGVTSIGLAAFECCSQLESVTIPDGVVSIGDYAFNCCSSLVSVTIPSSVTRIGESSFSCCDKLTTISVDESNINYASQDGILYNKNKTELMLCPDGKSGSVVIPNSVIFISDDAFTYCRCITGVIIPGSVTGIGEGDCGVFYCCNKLTSISVASANKNYSSQDGILYNKNKTELIRCPGGKSGKVTIPSGVSCLSEGSFAFCEQITRVTIPNSVIKVGDGDEFRGCSSLVSVIIGSGLKAIGGWMFSECVNLASITIPSSVTSIDDGVFAGCSSLKNIYYCGTQTQWNGIMVSDWCNDALTGATIYYNCRTVTYNANGGKVVPDSGVKISGKSYTIPTTKPTRAGYTFLGWSNSKTATTAKYLPGKSYTSIYLTLYAVWAKNSTVTFNANGGSGGPKTGIKAKGVAYTIPTTKPTRAGYTFLGWSNSKTATTAKYLPGKSYSSIYLTLYAVWAKNSTITFNANGGSGGPKTGIKAKGVAYTIPTTKPTRTGYTFLGWSNSKTATTAKYLPGKSYSSIYLTLYAVWQKK